MARHFAGTTLSEIFKEGRLLDEHRIGYRRSRVYRGACFARALSLGQEVVVLDDLSGDLEIMSTLSASSLKEMSAIISFMAFQ